MSIENGCYYCKSCDICDNKDCLVNKQKAEIERLTEELESKKKECREIADDYQEMGTFYYNETVKTAELQKQVDELEIVNSNLVKRINRIGRDTAKEIFDWLKSEVIMTEIPHGGEPSEEDVEAVMWWQIEEHFKKHYGVEVE